MLGKHSTTESTSQPLLDSLFGGRMQWSREGSVWMLSPSGRKHLGVGVCGLGQGGGRGNACVS
jgi:hypothetical protein